jgi:hypothetical protein
MVFMLFMVKIRLFTNPSPLRCGIFLRMQKYGTTNKIAIAANILLGQSSNFDAINAPARNSYVPYEHRASNDGFATLSQFINRQNTLFDGGRSMFDVGRSNHFTCDSPDISFSHLTFKPEIP